MKIFKLTQYVPDLVEGDEYDVTISYHSTFALAQAAWIKAEQRKAVARQEIIDYEEFDTEYPDPEVWDLSETEFEIVPVEVETP